MLQNATSLRKSAPWPPNISDEHVSCTALATRHASLQILCKCPTPVQNPHFCSLLARAESLAPATQNRIGTFKIGPSMWCFWHVDLEMCFAPQRRALFRHHNFQKWSGVGVLCTFWLGNVLPRHNAVRFFDITTSKSGPTLVCFVHFDLEMRFTPRRRVTFHLSSDHMAPHPPLSEPTVRPSGATNHWQNTVFRDFPTFSRTCFFFLLTLTLLWSSLFGSSPHWLFPPLLFHLSILLEVWRPTFLRLRSVRTKISPKMASVLKASQANAQQGQKQRLGDRIHQIHGLNSLSQLVKRDGI